MKEQELRTIVIYDVENDRIRAKIAAACKDFGLDPIQYSAFSGTLNATSRKQLFARLADTLGKAPGRVLMIPLCKEDVAALSEVNNIGAEPEAKA